MRDSTPNTAVRGMLFLLTVYIAGIVVPARLRADTTHDLYDLNVDTVIGYAGIYRMDTWVPVSIRIANEGRNIAGTLSLEKAQGSAFSIQGSVIYAKRLDLPGRSSKRFSFVIPLRYTSQPLTVRVMDGETEAYTREIDVKGGGIQTGIILALSRRPTLDFLFRFWTEERNIPNRIILYPLVDFLPDRWYGYDGVELVVLHDTHLRNLTHEQVSALGMWVSAGGVVVISGGMHFGDGSFAKLKDLMPATFTGTEEIRLPVRIRGVQPSFSDSDFSDSDRDDAILNTIRDSVLTAGTAAGTSGDSRIAITRITDVAGETFMSAVTSEGEIPLAVRHSYDRGVVYFLAFDYAARPFLRWEGRTALWGRILAESRGARPLAGFFDYTHVTEEIIKEPLHEFPSSLIVLISTVGYALFFGLLLRFNRKKKRLRWLTYVVPLVAMLVTVGTLYRETRSVEGILLDFSVAEVSLPSEHVPVLNDLMLVTLADRPFGIRTPETGALFSLREERDLIVQEDRGGLRVEDVISDGWSREQLRMYSLQNLTVSGGKTESENLIELSMKNESGYKIEDACLVHAGMPYYIGTFMPDDEMKESLRKTQVLRRPEDDWDYFMRGWDPIRAKALRTIVLCNEWREIREAYTLVVGWLPTPLVAAEPDVETIKRVSAHMVLIKVPMGEYTDPAADRFFGIGLPGEDAY